jgi:hypothetical protein
MSSEIQNHPPFYRSTRVKTILSVLISVLALGGAGMLAGALTHPSPPVAGGGSEIQTGGDGFPPPAPEQILLPQVQSSYSPGGTATSPSPGGTSPSPGTSPSAVSGSPSPEASATPDASGGDSQTAVLGGGVVTIVAPSPWKVDWVADDGFKAALSTGAGDFSSAALLNADPTTTTADGVMAELVDQFLPLEYYTQRQVSDIQPQEPFGNLASMASIAYKAIWVDSQSSFPVFGNMWVGVRQDGNILLMTAESSPEEKFSEENWRPIIDPTFVGFANG